MPSGRTLPATALRARVPPAGAVEGREQPVACCFDHLPRCRSIRPGPARRAARATRATPGLRSPALRVDPTMSVNSTVTSTRSIVLLAVRSGTNSSISSSHDVGLLAGGGARVAGEDVDLFAGMCSAMYRPSSVRRRRVVGAVQHEGRDMHHKDRMSRMSMSEVHQRARRRPHRARSPRAWTSRTSHGRLGRPRVGAAQRSRSELLTPVAHRSRRSPRSTPPRSSARVVGGPALLRVASRRARARACAPGSVAAKRTRHRPALGDAEERRALDPGRVHHRPDVVHPRLEVGRSRRRGRTARSRACRSEDAACRTTPAARMNARRTAVAPSPPRGGRPNRGCTTSVDRPVTDVPGRRCRRRRSSSRSGSLGMSTLASFPGRDRAATGHPGAKKGRRSHRYETPESAYFPGQGRRLQGERHRPPQLTVKAAVIPNE